MLPPPSEDRFVVQAPQLVRLVPPAAAFKERESSARIKRFEAFGHLRGHAGALARPVHHIPVVAFVKIDPSIERVLNH